MFSVFYKIRNHGYSLDPRGHFCRPALELLEAGMSKRGRLLEKNPAPSLRHLTAKDYGRLKDSQREVVALLYG